MFCPHCGEAAPDDATRCPSCHADLAQAQNVAQSSGPVMADSFYGADYAGFWKRAVAAIIDGILITVIFQIAMAITGSSPLAVSVNIISLIFSWLYFALQESSAKQATLGKRAMSIKVTDLSGNRLGLGRATGRHFAKIISYLLLCIGFIMVAFTKKKQGLHDIIADTLVVRT